MGATKNEVEKVEKQNEDSGFSLDMMHKFEMHHANIILMYKVVRMKITKHLSILLISKKIRFLQKKIAF